MHSTKALVSILSLSSLMALGACGTSNPYGADAATPQPYPQSYPQSSNPGGVYSGYGVVQSIDLVRQGNTGIGIGTVAGAVIGGIVGNQVGGGRGNTAATVLGVAGGAYAGHELEKGNQAGVDAYRISVRMENGTYQTLTQSANVDLRVGDRVQIDNGVARRY